MELRELFVKQMNSLYLKIVHDTIILLQFILQLKTHLRETNRRTHYSLIFFQYHNFLCHITMHCYLRQKS